MDISELIKAIETLKVFGFALLNPSPTGTQQAARRNPNTVKSHAQAILNTVLV